MLGESTSSSKTSRIKQWLVSSRVVISMLLVQLFATGMMLLSKIILDNGTFIFALMTYRHVVAALCLAPFAYFFERDFGKRLRWTIFFLLLGNSLAGMTMPIGMYYYGIKDTSATYASNFLSITPTATFIISVITRFETLGLRSRAGKAKTLGAILCIIGPLTSVLYKGKVFHLASHNLDHHVQVKVPKTHLARGSLFLIGYCLSYGVWYVLQVKLMKVFPLKYSATMLTCCIAALQSSVIGLCLDRSKAAWSLGWNLQLLAIFYSGALISAASYCLISWAVAKRGPTYPSMFSPLSSILVALLEALFLGADLTVGTLLGMSMIIIGLYSLMWGKQKEMKNLLQRQPPQSTLEDTEVQDVVTQVGEFSGLGVQSQLQTTVEITTQSCNGKP